MEFLLTDLGLGLAALFGYWTYGILAGGRAPLMARTRHAAHSPRRDVPPRELRLVRRSPSRGTAPHARLPAGVMTVDPRRLVHFW